MGTTDRREREKQHRIDAILDAALELFAEKGVKNATMDQVAEKAELSKGTLYLYFKSKEHMYFALDMRAGMILKERFAEAARSEKTGHDKVRAIGRAYYQFCNDFPNHFKAMSYIDNLDMKTYQEVANEMIPGGAAGYKETSLKILHDAIEIGHKDGTIAEIFDPWMTSNLLWATSNGVIAMIRNKGDFLKQIGLPIDKLYDLKELMVHSGISPDGKKITHE